NAEVSDASVVRFARSVGYKGFQDFKMDAARDLLPRSKQLNPILEQEDDTETICRKIFASEINVLNRTLAGLETETVDLIVDKINKARRVAIFGTGGSYIVAADAQHKFLKIGVETVCHVDADMQQMTAALLTKDDVALCISFSGNNYHVIDCMRSAKNSGAFCVGIISQGKSQLAKIVDAILYASYDETLFQSESVSTRIAQLAIIDVLVSKLAIENYDRSYNAIHLTREATLENKI
ncbi:MAG: MurR/RpiR family transcriptional regulator, partial [Lachnospiraceae bacterium]|nr:MurR/RpiR family transcriptional regulator [Lachnospiraceae bacterium]